MSKLLLVEDDNSLAIGILYAFKDEGFECVHAQTKTEAKALFNESYNIVILDVELPDGSGYDVCKDIRSISNVPIIFLTSYDDEVNIVMGLDMGADDYVTKPFQLKVLFSRIKANLRRSTTQTKNVITAGDIEINLPICQCFVKSRQVNLTVTEFKLLAFLMSNANKTLTRDSILQQLWDINGKFIDDNTISVHIRHLREKLRNESSNVTVVTIRGIGYRLES